MSVSRRRVLPLAATSGMAASAAAIPSGSLGGLIVYLPHPSSKAVYPARHALNPGCLGSDPRSDVTPAQACAVTGSTFADPSCSLRGLAHRGRTTTTSSRRRSTAPATAFATVVLILVFAVPASASDEPGDAGASGATGATLPMAPTPPAGALPGIDVSRHQGTIDWSLVASSGTRFAFAKATEGRTYVDPMYA